jgi:SCY1-like protein 2
MAAIECPTHSIVDAAMRSLPGVLPVLDFSTIKNELFPVVATVFSKTNSLAIKVRGLQAFVILCGGSTDAAADDGLNGLSKTKPTSSSSALDKYTMQEKIVPLIKAIKTKEPAVMMAALNVLRIVGQAADSEFVAMEILPVLWSMSLGPLLELKQFQTFMELIRSLSTRVEEEHTKKLQELSGTNGTSTSALDDDFMAFGGVTGTSFEVSNGAADDDFESLVKGKTTRSPTTARNELPSWDDPAPAMASTSSTARSSSSTPQTPAFSWSTPTASPAPSQANTVRAQQASFRTVTPDLNRFESLTPSSTQFSQPLQPAMTTSPSTGFSSPPSAPQQQMSSNSVNWSSASSGAAANPWASSSSTTPNYSSNTSTFGSSGSAFGGSSMMNSSMSNMSIGQRPSISNTQSTSFSLKPPPGSSSVPPSNSFGIAPPPAQQSNPWASTSSSMGSMMRSSQGVGMGGIQPPPPQQQQQPQKQGGGLDKYASLI